MDIDLKTPIRDKAKMPGSFEAETMTWLSLLLLIPIALVAIVSLFGFSGCEAWDVVVDISGRLEITQRDSSSLAINFSGCWLMVGLTRHGGGDPDTVINLPQDSSYPFIDQGLREGTTYVYWPIYPHPNDPSLENVIQTGVPPLPKMTTTLPMTPTAVIAQVIAGVIELSWTNNASTKIVKIEYRADSDDFTAVTGPIEVTRFPYRPPPPAEPSRFHQYRVRSVIMGFHNVPRLSTTEIEVASLPSEPSAAVRL